MTSNAGNMGQAINRADRPYVRAAERPATNFNPLPKGTTMQGSRINGRPGPNLRITRQELDAKIKAAAAQEAKRAARREVKRRKPEIKAAARHQVQGQLQKSANAEHLRRLMAARSAPHRETIGEMQERFNRTTDPLQKSVLGERLTYERLRRMIAVRGR